MMRFYCADGRCLSLDIGAAADALTDAVVWIDMVEPTHDEDRMMERLLGISIPTRDELKDIEPSSRLYVEEGATFMTASLVAKADSEVPHLTDVGFILAGGRLVTVRYAAPKAFSLFIGAMHRIPGGCPSGLVLLTRLMETIVDRTAEILEQLVGRVDALSLQVFGEGAAGKRRPPRYLESRLLTVAGHHRLVAMTRDSLASLSRLMTFLYALPPARDDRETRELCRSISRDIQSLSEHASFISGNITFLLDASLGLINIEQNTIIKIFSIASVVFLPPTLVASAYGMNFAHMPELQWTYGYPLAIAAMVVSAAIPYVFFRWKGWL
ncbi:magnesium transporter CorA family protein [Ensifer soli]|uniref:magnesium transporter CorA family protein n=1 Tax=Ciceribacter sp. sgz301302 TaxID=3342379 RepID=UPI0035B897E8